MVDDIVVAGEDAVREPVVAHELPDVFGGVELGAFGWQRQDSDVRGDVKLGRHVPTCLIHQENSVLSGCHFRRDFRHQQVHRRGVATRQDQCCRFAVLWAYCAKDICRCCALIVWCRWPAAAQRPAPGHLILLADPGLIFEPDFYVAGLQPLIARDFFQARGEVLWNGPPLSPLA